jgi:hypothetical protein
MISLKIHLKKCQKLKNKLELKEQILPNMQEIIYN